MDTKIRTGIAYHNDYLKHDTGTHPECKERLIVIMKAIENNKINKRIVNIFNKNHEIDKKLIVNQIELVHNLKYIKYIQELSNKEWGILDSDTIISKDSYDASLRAVDGIISSIDAIMDGMANAFVLARPPGHHAFSNRGSGFCIFNNIAIGARYAQKKYNLKKVLIVDWDVHHGNGTQDIFYDDSSVLYFSTHQSIGYPGTGKINEVGANKGIGFNINIPMPMGVGDAEFVQVFKDILVPIALEFNPDIVLISAGQDTHAKDHLGGMNMTELGFKQLASIVKYIADLTAKGKMVAVLEGGYNLDALSASVINILDSFIEKDANFKNSLNDNDFKKNHNGIFEFISEIKQIQKKYWKSL
ncbi:MAG: histone deacetylase [Methanosarcinaceae archaeon]|jgi:acetoin utilization deacetylase AcuC-like enzyme|nr:histone deacetylase [Methanosarcinaceae archaeon]NKQ39033.1 histone deacetylase [Methanosarcinales archaeon]